MAKGERKEKGSDGGVPSNVKVGDMYFAAQGVAERPRDMTKGYPDTRVLKINEGK